MGYACCWVLPSRFEPWGVAIHEATSAGLGVICSSACGASAHLVQDGRNGFVVRADDEKNLGNALMRYASLLPKQTEEMSDHSYYLSSQFTPKRWASYFHKRAQELLP